MVEIRQKTQFRFVKYMEKNKEDLRHQLRTVLEQHIVCRHVIFCTKMCAVL